MTTKTQWMTTGELAVDIERQRHNTIVNIWTELKNDENIYTIKRTPSNHHKEKMTKSTV